MKTPVTRSLLWLSLVAVAVVPSLVFAQSAPGTPLPPMAPANAPANAQAGEPGKKPAFMGGKWELEMKEKLETLVKLSPQQLDDELQKWPRYQQMDLGERAKLLQRIQEFKDRRRKQAENKARDLGLKLTPEQFAVFEEKFWDKRLHADRQLWQEMEPRRKQLEQQLNSELKQEFALYLTPPPPPKPAPTQVPAASSTAPMTPASAGTTP